MSKSSHLPAVAGTLAGLLAAAFGAWYLYPQHVGPGTAPARPIPSTAPAAASGAKAGANAGANAATGAVAAGQRQALSRDQAVARLMALPELRAWARRIETASGGTVRGAVIPFDPALRSVDGRPYHQLSFVENRPDAVVTWQSFLVGADDGEILVEDDEALLPLERWRSEKRPMARAVPDSAPRRPE